MQRLEIADAILAGGSDDEATWLAIMERTVAAGDRPRPRGHGRGRHRHCSDLAAAVEHLNAACKLLLKFFNEIGAEEVRSRRLSR